ncbi:hypothetical protein BJX99DRAFT_72992 [Aspergillus californicus]
MRTNYSKLVLSRALNRSKRPPSLVSSLASFSAVLVKGLISLPAGSGLLQLPAFLPVSGLFRFRSCNDYYYATLTHLQQNCPPIAFRALTPGSIS